MPSSTHTNPRRPVKVMDPDFEILEVKVADGKAGEESKRVG